MMGPNTKKVRDEPAEEHMRLESPNSAIIWRDMSGNGWNRSRIEADQ
jgi:hypothetical protein